VKLLLDRVRGFVEAEATSGFELHAERQGADGSTWWISIGNGGSEPAPLVSGGIVIPIEATGPVRMFANGYQSWSPTGVVTLGVDVDPSARPDGFELLRAAHHADPRPAAGDELRSELVCVLADDTGDIALVGWLGGDQHDGTLRLRTGPDGPELVVDAFFGGAVFQPGEQRECHPVAIATGDRGEHPVLLERWASQFGRAAGARADATFQVGWCSWYHYFEQVTEEAMHANLALASDWPFDVFQLDDGYQRNVGDWLETDETFPSGLGDLADRIAAAGMRPGIWIAPFVASRHAPIHSTPGAMARAADGSGDTVPGSFNDHWDGVVDTLDTSNPEVQDFLASVASGLVEMGWTYLKLDFTYAPSFPGIYADPSMTPAQRVRAGYDAIRRGAGDDTFILGCGAPLGPCVGVVDGMRIGPDVAPHWEPRPGEIHCSGYVETGPSTRSAWQSTLARSFMHRRLWLNDPDCLMLRHDATDLSADAARAWAHAVAASGGMAIVSDDLALLDGGARALLDEVVRTGREVDDEAADRLPPSCPDLLDARPPTTLTSAVVELVGDPEAATAELRRP
jgi:alpha-galactosidase